LIYELHVIGLGWSITFS